MGKRRTFLFPWPVKKPSIDRLTGLLLLCGLTLSVRSQTNISGIINSYHQVLEVIPSKSCVRLNTVSGLAYGDKAMLVQMKGVSINTSTSSAFGDTTGSANAGNYEIVDICYVRGDSVFFVYMQLNSYTAADKVQLVRMPQYASANVTDTLKAAPWNPAAGTGGVLALWVDQDLFLNAPIYADGAGYRGGAYVVSNNSCSDAVPASGYVYNGGNTSPQSGSYKGEGAADVAAAQSGGRGAPANGGGGGNNHNNGGAGGANLATGGNGGGNSSTVGCTASLPGRAGKALSNYGGRKIFMGGGGGAGHVNNNLAVSNGGGHGGGIVFINAPNLFGNGFTVSANGQQGGPAASDGASGGGAGGTIILNIGTVTGTVNFSANGGGGGTEADGGNIGRCYGAGGGGSGGVVYQSSATPLGTISVAGGFAGAETGRDASCGAIVAPGAGSAGTMVQSYAYRRSSVLTNGYCASLLPHERIAFQAAWVQGFTELNWYCDDPGSMTAFVIEVYENGWTTTAVRPAEAAVRYYESRQEQHKAGYHLYRVKMVRTNGTIAYSETRRIYVPSAQSRYSLYPVPAKDRIMISGDLHDATLRVTDAGGRQLWQASLNSPVPVTPVQLPLLSRGIYFLHINGEVLRLLIQ